MNQIYYKGEIFGGVGEDVMLVKMLPINSIVKLQYIIL